ncbi:response regulator transcription factor [Pelagibius sp.]|uniref:response regulator transcription factor n=1 Tax=Pelagibius sp. TaxID=1931238 RepID=UPI002610B160|nr:response regulator transcription factor [Pelagibius sp.]
MRILLVEDNAALADGVIGALQQMGHTTDLVVHGDEALDALAVGPFDLVILDLTLPGLDGLDVLRELRARNRETPVLILTARTGVSDKVKGLDLGADDYLCKPFELAELEARVRALLRRQGPSKATLLQHGELAFDTLKRTASLCGSPLELSRRETAVLEVLLSRPGHVVSKEFIAERIFSFDDEAQPSAIEIYIHRLRKKITDKGPNIRTVRGLGYMLED